VQSFCTLKGGTSFALFGQLQGRAIRIQEQEPNGRASAAVIEAAMQTLPQLP